METQLEEASTTQARLRLDLGELLKAHRQQGRVLERNQKVLEQTEQELGRSRGRTTALESEVGEQRKLAEQHARRVQELEQAVAEHATMQTAYETLDRERQDLTARLSEITRSRATAQTERDRLAGELASAHATMAARDAEVAALKVEQETVEAPNRP
jgi:chromosome segregation ATPase